MMQCTVRMDEQQPETPETPDAEAPAQDAPEAPAVPTPELPAVEPQPAEQVVADAPSVEEIVEPAQPAEEIVAEQPPAEEVVAAAEQREPAPEAPAAEPEPPTAGAPTPEGPAADAPATDTPAPDQAAAPEAPGAGGKRKRPRRRKGSKVAEQWGVSKTTAQKIATKVDAPKPRRGPKSNPPSRGRSREPLPFDELRAAAQCITDLEGSRKALRDAFGELAPKERNDISRLVSDDGDFRQRARSISAGSLAARKIGKALAAQQVAIAALEDMWAVTLSKEEAAERLSRVRRAKNRDRERAKRNEERANRADRVSREDLAKAQDGRVGAQIRFVVEGEDKRDRKGKKKKQPATANDLLDKLGY
ncbi:MAG TPA: hypothetical protein VFZ89_16500 [Solirubrobacteraceae bacterium]